MKHLILLMLFFTSWQVFADYDDYCYEMAGKLATNPGAMKLGELDGLKSCISELQSAGVILHAQPALARRSNCPVFNLDKLCPKPNLKKVCPPFMVKFDKQRNKEGKQQEKKKLYKPVIQAF